MAHGAKKGAKKRCEKRREARQKDAKARRLDYLEKNTIDRR